VSSEGVAGTSVPGGARSESKCSGALRPPTALSPCTLRSRGACGNARPARGPIRPFMSTTRLDVSQPSSESIDSGSTTLAAARPPK